MSEFLSVKAVCERIFELESEHGLLDFEVDGVKVWQYARMSIYYRVAQACRVLDDPHPAPSGLYAKLRERLSNLKSILFHNPLYVSGTIDTLVVDHPRSMMLNGSHVDIYTHFLLKRLEENCDRFLVIEKPFRGAHSRKPSRLRTHTDSILLFHRLRHFLGIGACSKGGLEQISWINQIIRNAFNIDVDFRPLLIDAVTRFKSNSIFYARLLVRLKPKKIFVVDAYTYLGDLIWSAKEAGIETVEIQHGVFSRYHLGYSYSERTVPLDYFPDKFMVWGNFWRDLIDFPVSRQNVIVDSFPFFHKMREKYSEIFRRKNCILVLSQGAIGRALSDVFATVIRDLSDFELIYKLHPSEYSGWRDYPSLVEIARHKNVRIVDHNVDLYQLFAEAEYQIGVFSTAIYEGIGMGCKTVLLDLPGREYMKRLIDKKLAVLLEPGQNLIAALRSTESIDCDLAVRDIFGEKDSDLKML